MESGDGNFRLEMRSRVFLGIAQRIRRLRNYPEAMLAGLSLRRTICLSLRIQTVQPINVGMCGYLGGSMEFQEISANRNNHGARQASCKVHDRTISNDRVMQQQRFGELRGDTFREGLTSF